MKVRHVRESDYIPVISVVNDWWGGRHMADMLPKLFFQHIQDTSYIAEQDGQLIGFLIGFVSQTYPTEAYIHFIGVHPDYRKDGVAKSLYRMFFDKVQAKGCKVVRCVTSPVNKTSIAFHTRMGFQIEEGNGEVDGVPVTRNYDGKGQDRVLFAKELG
ncbi:GNAT family N-acetyltransferase [Brevibacillus migulae]|uniref:GNAT family N-acetyltransferase n=1 Tax=Brevibacillus migulae TaxID=1644114 RepID=UPI00106F02F2|nr:GNAT family N-acetyltransferase [Brevibacillus migulae]